MPDASHQLTTTLGTPPPPEFAALTPDELTLLDTYVRGALDQRKAALDDALESGMRLIPRLARPAVKKVLGL
ncbi:hypothetical protein [Nocardia caishijiensis]|uniref:Uncharacterized protein n=1 Tax=Nocardia caishijiensis TaxID=184756 RepID=A0ABQ6YG38_9NOCA|nr:hypothetical protein [Nocardia caishijiensis]KAF0842558.1 hypothetical protein FNL39_111139 [Nocardia caishijiensis]